MDSYRDCQELEADPKRQRQLRVELRELFSIARRHFRPILGLGLLTGVLAGALSLALPNRYEAVTTIRIDQRAKSTADAAMLESEIALVRSKVVARRVSERLGLRDDAELTQPAPVERWLAALGIPWPSPSVAKSDVAARQFESRLDVRRVGSSALIEIRFASADPAKAARIVNAVADSYIGLQIEAKTHAAELASDGERQLRAGQQLAREMEALAIARHGTALAKLRYEKARRMMLGGEGNEAIADVLQSQAVRLRRDELGKVLRREAELAAKLGPKHPDMQKVAIEVAKAQAELGAEIGKITKGLKAELAVAAGRERQLQASVAMLRDEIARSKEKQAQSPRREPADAVLVSAAGIPHNPAAPRLGRIALLGVLAGLGLGFGMAYLVAGCANGCARSADVEARLGLAHLASLPIVARGTAGGGDELRIARLMVADPHGSFADSVGVLRHELDTRAQQGPGRTILVASAVEGEGKTTLASNLALAYAAADRRTLLIDADLRNRMLTAKLGVDRQPGLAEAIVHGLPPHSVALRDARSGLSFLPAGTVELGQLSPAETLGAPGCCRLLRHLQGHFDVIVLDAPALLPVRDARVLASLADQIVFVLRWQTTPRVLAMRALRHLGASGSKVAGAVLNQADALDRPAISGHGAGAALPPFPIREREVA